MLPGHISKGGRVVEGQNESRSVSDGDDDLCTHHRDRQAFVASDLHVIEKSHVIA
jgi:hypothetical protein